MYSERKISLPLSKEDIRSLRAGDAVRISGTIYTARDAAHKLLTDALAAGESLPFKLKNACIYYTGPCPEIPGRPINACGPTTSKRMDTYAPTLYDAGVGCVIGKGKVGEAVKAAIVRNGAIYFGAVGGAGALIAKSVKSCTLVAYPELLAEAVYRLEVEDFPAYVAVDTEGGDIYELGPKTYRTD